MLPSEVVLADRIILLNGGQNFREVGGYPAGKGRKLSRGKLWRSAKLNELTSEDVAAVQSLGIATIADLRRPGEREVSPTPVHLIERVKSLSWDIAVPQDEALATKLFKEDADRDHYFDAMLHMYRHIAQDHAEQLGDLYRVMADGELPILIHCAAGKDRTGIAIGLLLDLIGVDRAYILADYARTEQLLDWERLTAAAALGAGIERHWLHRLSPLALEQVCRSDERYLAAAFEEIENAYGSTMEFARQCLGVTDDVLDRLRRHLLQA